ncbi:EF hand [Fontimonas thermophila]|uniref:EF hand n=1 Tax=Fontimonas thermophila TaxID=1076937 RepID=A0A1I2H172_9GAMM|nr:hypothetical protein [Fontimonas thermophila]SFF23140.1 EF hand [Fontimonas thermophila]
MRLLPLVVAAIAASAACTPRYGERRSDALDPLRPAFNAADRDHDENLTRAEVESGMAQLLPYFADIDTDGNGRISAGELRSWLEWQRVLRAPPPDVPRDR